MSVVLSTLLALFFLAPRLGSKTSDPISLTVAAASDLTNLEPDLQTSFHSSIRFVTAASGVLSQQIANGAPYDVFLSANAQFVDQLGSNGKLLPSSIVTYAVGRVGVLWRDGKSHPLTDLRQSSVRVVALPNPKLAPYGVAAQQALEHAGVWGVVSQKLVYGENVRQTLQLFESGNADAVLTSDSLLQGKKADVIPAGWHQPVVQKAGIVAASPNQDLARRFLQFLTGPRGQAVFARYGFSKS